jgi:DNA helicase-4
LFDSVKETINKIRKREKKAKIYVIGRYSEQYYEDLDFDVIKVGTRLEEPGLEIEYYTAHSSKGKEADYVILIGLRSGRLGFPSEIEDDPVTNLLLTKNEEYPTAEERRLFYVGMTRARKNLYILADNLRISPFAAEITKEGYQYELLGNHPSSE